MQTSARNWSRSTKEDKFAGGSIFDVRIWRVSSENSLNSFLMALCQYSNSLIGNRDGLLLPCNPLAAKSCPISGSHRFCVPISLSRQSSSIPVVTRGGHSSIMTALLSCLQCIKSLIGDKSTISPAMLWSPVPPPSNQAKTTCAGQTLNYTLNVGRQQDRSNKLRGRRRNLQNKSYRSLFSNLLQQLLFGNDFL